MGINTNIDYKLIGARIRAERKQLGYTQEKLAEQLDVSVGYISQVERGVTKISLDFLGSVAAALSCDPSYFIAETAVKSNTYLLSEIGSLCEKLSVRERKIVSEFIKFLTETRNRE